MGLSPEEVRAAEAQAAKELEAKARRALNKVKQLYEGITTGEYSIKSGPVTVHKFDEPDAMIYITHEENELAVYFNKRLFDQLADKKANITRFNEVNWPVLIEIMNV